MGLLPTVRGVSILLAEREIRRLAVSKLGEEAPAEVRLADTTLGGDVELPPMQSIFIWKVPAEIAEVLIYRGRRPNTET